MAGLTFSLSLGLWTSAAADKAGPAPKGEQIKFSGGEKGSTSVKPDAADRLPEGDLLDFLRRPRGGGAGDVEVPISRPQNSRANSRQLQDLMDKEKNWIFLTPESLSNDSLSQERKPEDMFNLRDELGGASKKSSKTLEEFWAKDDGKPSSQANKLGRSSTLEDHKQSMFGGNSPADPQSSPGKPELASWNSLFGPKDRTDPAATTRELYGPTLNPNGNLPSALSTSGTGLSEFSSKTKPEADEFSKLLRSSSPNSLVSSPTDPVNSAVDASDQDINPVVGRRLSDASKGFKSLDSPGFPKANNLPLATFAPGTLSDLNARLAEQANQRPAFTPPAESKPVLSRPAVLELPKRKF